MSKVDGKVACWGDNIWGELGNGFKGRFSSPQPVQGFGDQVFVNSFDSPQ
jgi:hypothetical protein